MIRHHGYCVSGGRKRGGFTVVELLVVIGIIGLLLSILIPTVFRARAAADRARTARDLGAIDAAITAFENATHDIPRSYFYRLNDNTGDSWGGNGARALGMCLIGYHDLGDSNGPPKNKTYHQGYSWHSEVVGPFLNPGQFKQDEDNRILDHNGIPINYYPKNPYQQRSINPVNGTGGPVPLDATLAHGYVDQYSKCQDKKFNRPAAMYVWDNGYEPGTRPYSLTTDEKSFLSDLKTYGLTLAGMQAMMGCYTDNGNSITGADHYDPSVTGQAVPFTGPYILWAAGPDGRFGPQPSDGTSVIKAADIGACDDVTSFNQ